LKGEFTSNFGTNTNAVSQIFKEGGFVNDRKRLYMIIGGVVAVIILAFVFLMPSDDVSTSEEDGLMTEEDDLGLVEDGETAGEEAATDEMGATATDPTATTDAATTDATATATGTDAAVATDAAAPAAVSGSVTVIAPVEGQSRAYDEASQAAVFQWEGSAQSLVFSRSQSMTPAARIVDVSGQTSYEFLNPHPGAWYWQIKAADGTVSEVKTFNVLAPERLNLVIGQPAAGGTLAGTGGMISWTAPHTRVAFYRVEFSASGSFARPDFLFSTSGTSVQVNGVTPGSYQVRLGGFSEISGQWEYSAPIQVTAQ
jgi:hypothetical protein